MTDGPPTSLDLDRPPRGDPGDTDRRYLEQARSVARLGWGHVHPNPMVGCVLVKDGAVIGTGHHAVFGGPHAEIVALEEAGDRARGATAYVSLEPCNHHGQTPPCSAALIQAGVARVVYGAAEPGEEEGGGGAALRAAGIEVQGPLWDERMARAENPAFHHVARHGTPFVALKLAMSLDGMIAAGPRVRTRLTGAEADEEVHRLRSGFDAIMVGGGTARADDPRLTVRLARRGRVPPRRIVLSTSADVPDDAALFDDIEEAPLHVFVSEEVSEHAIERLEERGAHVHPVAASADGVALDAVTGICWDLGIASILCEGGAGLTASLLRERRVHRLLLFVAPTTLGRAGVPAFPPDADELDWHDFVPAFEPRRLGLDTLIGLDREG